VYLIGFVGLILLDLQENRHSGEGKEVDSIKVLIERASIKSLFKRKEGWQSDNAAPSESNSSEFGG